MNRSTITRFLVPVTLVVLAALPGCGLKDTSPGAPAAMEGVTSAPRGLYVDEIAPEEELLVIERMDADAPPPATTTGREGRLSALVPGEEREVPLPLEHTDVRARVSAFVASVNVTQRYTNPFDKKIEAVYVFPLPDNAAVSDFLMVIGERRIRGLIREREEARRIYEAAKRQGRVASLLTQERPNIFTQSVANIEPGKRIDVQITYFHDLPYRDGAYSFVFPMVVGPRFIPGRPTEATAGVLGRVPPTDQVPDAHRVTPPALTPDERSGHDISVRVEIDAGIPLEGIECRSHVVDVERQGPSRAVVSLSPRDSVPNKDLVLGLRVTGDRSRAAYLTHPDEDGGTFAVLLQPPGDLDRLPRIPREMVFVLDCSGSMRGQPLDIAKEAIERCLKRLGPEDTFQVIRFSEDASALGDEPVEATARNVRRGIRYLRSLTSGGGTQMIEGIKAALEFDHDSERYRIVSFWTDGFIGNEVQILAAIRERLGESRLFSFGIGSSVNRYLLAGMARMGRGSVYVGLHDSSVEAVDGFYRRACRPALRDVEIDWGGVEVDVYPRKIPDLYVGRPLLVTGRYRGAAPQEVRVRGRTGGEERTFALTIEAGDETRRHPALPKVWARRKISHLSDLEVMQPSEELKGEIIHVSLTHGVQCRYTAFLAVDSLSPTSGDTGVTVAVPVPVPEGVEYETTIGERPSGR